VTLRLLGGEVSLRKWSKYHLYGCVGAFPYFGFQVYFPSRCTAFRRACAEGVFEAENVRALQLLCRPGSYMFDVGANLGLMALPVLRSVPDSRVISFEPSPNALPWLRKTVARSSIEDRWQLVEKAVSCAPGIIPFSVSAVTEGLYDGLLHTRRTDEARKVKVEVTTLDLQWERLGRPDLSVIKIDVEGGELDVLRGGQTCLSHARPFVLTEWCPLNLKAYGIPNESLFRFVREHGYLLYALPQMIPVTSCADLNLQMMRTESFLLTPRP